MSEEVAVSAAAENDAPMDDSPDRKHRFYTYMGETVSNIPFRKTIWLFLIFLFVSSDIFINNVLTLFSNTIAFTGCPTPWGTLITAVIFCLMFILLDMFLE